MGSIGYKNNFLYKMEDLAIVDPDESPELFKFKILLYYVVKQIPKANPEYVRHTLNYLRYGVHYDEEIQTQIERILKKSADLNVQKILDEYQNPEKIVEKTQRKIRKLVTIPEEPPKSEEKTSKKKKLSESNEESEVSESNEEEEEEESEEESEESEEEEEESEEESEEGSGSNEEESESNEEGSESNEEESED